MKECSYSNDAISKIVAWKKGKRTNFCLRTLKLTMYHWKQNIGKSQNGMLRYDVLECSNTENK